MNSDENRPLLTAEIVSKYVAHHKLAPGQLSDLIITVHRAISHLNDPDEPDEVRTPAVSVRRSVHHDYVVCLDCGYQGKTLRRHIGTRHGLSRDEYRHRWGLKSDHPLTAPAYSERRSTMARELGLGRKATIETPSATSAPDQADQQTATTPKLRQRTRRAAKLSDVETSEALAAPRPARRGRPRSRPRVASQSEESASPSSEA
jgi:predicted transcriptional regulator